MFALQLLYSAIMLVNQGQRSSVLDLVDFSAVCVLGGLDVDSRVVPLVNQVTLKLLVLGDFFLQLRNGLFDGFLHFLFQLEILNLILVLEDLLVFLNRVLVLTGFAIGLLFSPLRTEGVDLLSGRFGRRIPIEGLKNGVLQFRVAQGAQPMLALRGGEYDKRNFEAELEVFGNVFRLVLLSVSDRARV